LAFYHGQIFSHVAPLGQRLSTRRAEQGRGHITLAFMFSFVRSYMPRRSAMRII
jgi:hypothetical protein